MTTFNIYALVTILCAHVTVCKVTGYMALTGVPKVSYGEKLVTNFSPVESEFARSFVNRVKPCLSMYIHDAFNRLCCA